MKKRLTIIFALLLTIGSTAKAENFESATDAVKNMGVGWNLGNTLDANNQTVSDITNDAYWGQQGLESETCWGQPFATQEFIQMMKKAGFTAIRVPVTWYNHMDKDGNVSEEWMKRVKEVVDYVISEGLYCILNVHHDTGADSKDASGKLTGYHWIKADADNYTTNKEKYVGLWKQIAETFKDYGQTLLFEGYNEMLDANSCWNYPTWYADGKNYDAAYAKKSLETINSYAQSFVSAVRGTGGNNTTRNLIVNTYAATSGGAWGNNTHPQEPLEQLVLPTDVAKNHLIVEVHSYPSITSGISSAKSGLDWTFNNLKEKLIDRLNVPVIIGEWGTSNVDNGSDYIDRRETMIAFCEYFVKLGKKYNIATFYWMGLSDGKARSQLVFNQPDLAETITKAYHGANYEGEYPTAETGDGVVFEGEQMLEWGTAINLTADLFTNLDNTATVDITYVQQYDQYEKEDDQYGMMQFWYNDWSTKIDVMAEGNTYHADFVPADVYGTGSGTEHTTTFSFDASTFNNMKKKGLLFQGHGIVVKKVVLKTNTGISSAVFKAGCQDAAIYNLSGQRIVSPQKGIYIQNGKKIIIK
ncbi:MAG: glycoside hydrolase family 5 protein [Prevotella sp.]|nr:glycoside hydrolase family 5 protein [Prevotella sp.]